MMRRNAASADSSQIHDGLAPAGPSGAAVRSPSAHIGTEEDQSLSEEISSGVAKGVSWSALNTGVLRFGQLLMNIVVARLIAPDEFGVFAVALTVFTILTQFSDLGVGAAISREPKRTRQIAPTVNTIVLTTAAVLSAIMILFAPWLATMLGAAQAASALRVLSITMVIGSFGTLPAAILTRDYRQKLRSVADIANFVCASIALVAMALGGGGVMALAWSRVVGVAVSSGILIAVVRERYLPGFDRQEARALIRFGAPLVGANTLNMIMSNVDFIVIGRSKGALQLGYYNLAYSMSGWPVSLFSSVLVNVTMTTLARARTSKAVLKEHFHAALAALSATSFPVSALCIGLAMPLTTTVYGQRWAPAAGVLAVLSLFGPLRVLFLLFSDLLVAIGLTRELFLIQLLWIGFLVPTMIICVERLGIVGAAWAHIAVSVLVVLPSYLVVIARRVHLHVGWMARIITVPLLGAIGAGVAARLVAGLFSVSAVQLVVGGVTGLVVYGAITGLWLYKNGRWLRRLYGPGADRQESPSSEPAAG